ncbi:MAG: hypothetical protein LBU10_02165 [Endomicrobium sp.]|jgi:hypothetical protein|nr:hypothetical protein [Endomicrobium sp.]
MFLPTTKKEIHGLRWDQPDVILVPEDAYIDSPFIGVAIIGSYLTSKSYR